MHPRRLIERYAATGLWGPVERALRRHLSGCASCRDHYDAHVTLERALSGAPSRPRPEEDARVAQQVLARIRDVAPENDEAPARQRPRWFDGLLLAPRPALAGGASLALAVLVAVGAGVQLMPGPVIGHLAMGNGVSVEGIRVDGGARIAIHAGDQVTISPRGAGEIQLTRGGTLRMHPDTEAVLSAAGAELHTGKVWFEIDRGNGAYQVLTPAGEVDVLGTSFVVRHDPQAKTEVRVLQGRVQVTSRAGGHVEVTGGHRTSLTASSDPATPVAYDPEGDRREWKSVWQTILEALRAMVEEMRRWIE